MSIGGQWIAPYHGTNEGTLVLDVDEIDDHFEAIVHVWDDHNQTPNWVTWFPTPSRSTSQRLEDLNIYLLDALGNPIIDAPLSELKSAGVQFPVRANVEFALGAPNALTVSWSTTNGGNGKAIAARSKAGEQSVTQPLPCDTWRSYKEFVGSLERNRYIFRGQSNSKWRLRTSFHRTWRANLRAFEAVDTRLLHQTLSALTKNKFDLRDPIHNLSFLSLVQHHGYPTPLLDWTRSPYVAAFFAFRDVDVRNIDQEDKIRIFKLDAWEWNKINQGTKLYLSRPQLVISDAIPFDNPRFVPQQSISTVSTVDDIEAHIQSAEARVGKTILEVIDLPATIRKEVISELALMGVTAGSLFPGIDGAC
jgi:hypothetical protein